VLTLHMSKFDDQIVEAANGIPPWSPSQVLAPNDMVCLCVCIAAFSGEMYYTISHYTLIAYVSSSGLHLKSTIHSNNPHTNIFPNLLSGLTILRPTWRSQATSQSLRMILAQNTMYNVLRVSS